MRRASLPSVVRAARALTVLAGLATATTATAQSTNEVSATEVAGQSATLASWKYPGSDLSPTCSSPPSGPSEVCADSFAMERVGVQHLDPLFVFLPGSGAPPGRFRFVLENAAYAGLRTVGLAYDNRKIKDECAGRDACDPTDYTNECAYYRRWEKVVEDPTTVNNPDHIKSEDTIAGRLHELLRQRGWHQYLNVVNVVGRPVAMSDIRWNRIVLGGFSQGANIASLVSLEQQVHGIFLVDGGWGGVCSDPSAPSGIDRVGYVDALTASGWPSEDGHRFMMFHENGFENPQTDLTLAKQLRDDAIAALGFGAVQDWDATVIAAEGPASSSTGHGTSYLDGVPHIVSDVISTDQAPAVGGAFGRSCTNHRSMAIGNQSDSCIPRASTLGFRATHRSYSHLYEAQVQGARLAAGVVDIEIRRGGNYIKGARVQASCGGGDLVVFEPSRSQFNLRRRFVCPVDSDVLVMCSFSNPRDRVTIKVTTPSGGFRPPTQGSNPRVAILDPELEMSILCDFDEYD